MIVSFFIAVVRFYRRFLSPLFPSVCRFHPTCSGYAIEALKKHGLVSGLLLSFKRIFRCHPFCEGGYDPVK